MATGQDLEIEIRQRRLGEVSAALTAHRTMRLRLWLWLRIRLLFIGFPPPTDEAIAAHVERGVRFYLNGKRV